MRLFFRLFSAAEAAEFGRGDAASASRLYAEAEAASSTPALRARAMDGRARCLARSGRDGEAAALWRALADRYSGFHNGVGHPFGLTARLRSAELEIRSGRAESGLKLLAGLAERMSRLEWPLDPAAFAFFLVEVEAAAKAVLEKEAAGPGRTELESRLEAARESKRWLDFLEDFRKSAVPAVVRAVKPEPDSRRPDEDPIRLVVSLSGVAHTVSVRPMLIDGRIHYGGVCRNLESAWGAVLSALGAGGRAAPAEIAGLVDENGRPPFGGASLEPGPDALLLPFRKLPLAWKLAVSGRPLLAEWERSGRREKILFGALLGLVVGLMALGAVLILRDIRREAEAVRLKDEFVHTVSHELKTPLTLIRLYAENMLDMKGMSQSERDEACLIIGKESERLSHLIGNVLDLSRIEAGRKAFDIRFGDLARTVRETLESYRYHLEKSGFSVRAEIPGSLPAIFDAEAMAGVLVNLLSNAAKFSPPGREITVRLERGPGRAVLRVGDQGRGIPAGDLKRIFDRFVRLSEAGPSEAGGSGLGLTLVKYVAEAHGGGVDVESEVGRGSVFSVWLPREEGAEGVAQ